MALAAFTATLNQSLGDSQYNVQAGGLTDPTTTAPVTTSVAADVATLVADGASPTQAHVTTLNTDWGTLLTAINAYTAASATAIGGADVTILFNTSKFTNMNQVRAASNALLRSAAASGMFTP